MWTPSYLACCGWTWTTLQRRLRVQMLSTDRCQSTYTFGTSYCTPYTGPLDSVCLQTTVHAKQNIRITICSYLLQEPPGAWLLLRTRQAPGWVLQLPPLEPEPEKTFRFYEQADCKLLGSPFSSFPMAYWVPEWRTQKKKMSRETGIEFEGGGGRGKNRASKARVSSPNTLPPRRKSLLSQFWFLIEDLPRHYSCNCYIAPLQTADMLFGQASRVFMHASTCPWGYHWAWESWKSNMPPEGED